MATAPIRTKRWTRLEYERLVGLGAFGPGDRISPIGARGLPDPRPAADTAFGWLYTAIRRLSSSDIVAPLGAPEARIAVADLLLWRDSDGSLLQ